MAYVRELDAFNDIGRQKEREKCLPFFLSFPIIHLTPPISAGVGELTRSDIQPLGSRWSPSWKLNDCLNKITARNNARCFPFFLPSAFFHTPHHLLKVPTIRERARTVALPYQRARSRYRYKSSVSYKNNFRCIILRMHALIAWNEQSATDHSWIRNIKRC